MEVAITSGADDVFMEYWDGESDWNYVSGGSELWVGNEGDTGWEWIEAIGTGLRFLNVQVPKNATITAAKLQIVGRGGTGTVVRSYLRGEAADNAAAFSDINYFSKTRTTANVAWNGVPGFIMNTTYNTPDFKAVVQEIVNRAGWASGNAMVIFWDDHGGFSDEGAHRIFHSYESDPAKAARLIITWE